LANIVGTATESLIRLLNEFKREGFIETAGRKIRVLQPKSLIMAAQR
jgi:CRP/FNR family transcriptional regulator